ncbi:TetR/AcrR family transcriptional regulator [Salininema proteolyticum]|uniref:TetR/AcrR family transcriptional regulator n=1 Tax=Salininema proteolyticum TaxID=1607685 RepID=A0ABV8U6J2_9ACTN
MGKDTKERIMIAARALAEESQSVQGVTISLESVAKRVGLTKPGLMYHYSSKKALMLGLVEYTAQRWGRLLAEAAGSGPEGLSPFDRHRAYVTVATAAELSRGDYWISTDMHYLPVLAEAWTRHLNAWLDVEGLSRETAALLDTARFAADGAWAAAATELFPARDLSDVRECAMRLIDEAEKS